MLWVLFESDLQKDAKLIPSKKDLTFHSQKLVPAKHKKSPIRKIKLPQKFSATRYMSIYLLKIIHL